MASSSSLSFIYLFFPAGDLMVELEEQWRRKR